MTASGSGSATAPRRRTGARDTLRAMNRRIRITFTLADILTALFVAVLVGGVAWLALDWRGFNAALHRVWLMLP